jgi:hypothetical protein
MLALLRITRRADTVCARLNAGLVAFAIVLALLMTGTWIARHPEMFQPDYDAAAGAIGFTEQESGP